MSKKPIGISAGDAGNKKTAASKKKAVTDPILKQQVYARFQGLWKQGNKDGAIASLLTNNGWGGKGLEIGNKNGELYATPDEGSGVSKNFIRFRMNPSTDGSHLHIRFTYGNADIEFKLREAVQENCNSNRYVLSKTVAKKEYIEFQLSPADMPEDAMASGKKLFDTFSVFLRISSVV